MTAIIAAAMRALTLASLLLGSLPLATPAAASQGKTEATRLGAHPGLTRLVLDVSQRVDFRTLVTDKGRRILVGFPSVDWEANRHRLQPFGPISRYDFMRRGLTRGLLVIHTSHAMRIERQFTLPPDPQQHRGNRMVIDLVAANHPGTVAAPR